MPDDTQVNPWETIEALKRELDARTAEHDEALAERAAMSEILQVINSSPVISGWSSRPCWEPGPACARPNRR